MKLNFEAPVRLTEALLPVLRRTAQTRADRGGRRVSIVNVASTAGRVSRPRSGAYSASKFALIGWSDALYGEESEHGLHVGMVLPGFIKTEGFPAADLKRIAASMARAAAAAGVSIVAGDTKVVPRGKADGCFINTSGVGHIERERTKLLVGRYMGWS